MKPPTAEQCTNNEVIECANNEEAMAIWLPQVGGYSSFAWAIHFKNDSNECFQVRVYHDGEFPKDEETIELHFCDPEQIIAFGTKLKAFVLKKEGGG